MPPLMRIPSYGKQLEKGSKQTTDGPPGFMLDDKLRMFCDKHYNQLLPPMAEKVYQEKLQRVQARLKWDAADQANRRRPTLVEEKYLSESENDRGGHWKPRLKKPKSTIDEEDVSQPWLYEETDMFTPRRNFEFPIRIRMPSNVKMYDGTEDPEDHLNIFQTAAKVERWAMLTWCHMFNSTLIGSARLWFDELPPESIDSYVGLRKAFLTNFLQQKKHIKDPVEIHRIKQKERESTEVFMKRFKAESIHVKCALELDEMMSVTTTFLRREVSLANQSRKKGSSAILEIP
ncbi:reverse transcriptase domain-containing protein [Tanacetum coccineum]